MPQFAVLIYSDDSAHEPAGPRPPQMRMAKAVRAEAVTDGPFVDSHQVVAGVYILDAPDLDAALATAATNPVLRQGGGLEVRPIHSGGPSEPPQP